MRWAVSFVCGLRLTTSLECYKGARYYNCNGAYPEPENDRGILERGLFCSPSANTLITIPHCLQHMKSLTMTGTIPLLNEYNTNQPHTMQISVANTCTPASTSYCDTHAKYLIHRPSHILCMQRPSLACRKSPVIIAPNPSKRLTGRLWKTSASNRSMSQRMNPITVS